MHAARQSNGRPPSVTVVIVSYNTTDWLRRCLQSIPTAASDHQFAAIVIDNASIDGSADLVAEEFPDIELIRNEENVGFARAVNLGTATVTTDYILLLNPDGFLQPGAIDVLIDFAEAHPEYVVCGGRTITPAGDLDPRSCWAAPTLWSLFCNAVMLSVLFPGSRLFAPEAMGSFKRDYVREVDIVTGCLLLIRTSDWRELGGFDERFFVYGEDADLSLRAASDGRRCAITPQALMVHAGGESSATDPHHHELVLAGRITLLNARWPKWKARLGRALVVVSVPIRSVIGRINNPERAVVWRELWIRRRNWWNGYPT